MHFSPRELNLKSAVADGDRPSSSGGLMGGGRWWASSHKSKTTLDQETLRGSSGLAMALLQSGKSGESTKKLTKVYVNKVLQGQRLLYYHLGKQLRDKLFRKLYLQQH